MERIELAFDKWNARVTPVVFVASIPKPVKNCGSKASTGRHLRTHRVASLAIIKDTPSKNHASCMLKLSYLRRFTRLWIV